MNSLHHSFDIALATEYGIHEAILIHHFQHWIYVNKRLKRNLHDGKFWTYQTLDNIAGHFGYLSKDQVNRTVRKLVKDGILIKGNFNKSAYDRTTWYAFKDEKRFIGEPAPVEDMEEHSPNAYGNIAKCETIIEKDDVQKVVNEEVGTPLEQMANSPNGNGEIATPIPYPIPYTKTKETLPKGSVKKAGVPPPNPPPAIIKFGYCVVLEDAKYLELCVEHGANVVDSYIAKINDYCECKGTPKRYKCFEAAIRQWIRKDQEAQASAAKKNSHHVNKGESKFSFRKISG